MADNFYPTPQEFPADLQHSRISDEEIQRILGTFEAYFQGEYKQNDLYVWFDYMDQESPAMIKRATKHITNQSHAREWIPNLSEFKRLVAAIRAADNATAHDVRMANVCKSCEGATWIKEPGSLSGIPCQNCLPETFKRWREGEYEAFAPQRDEEFTGPVNDYGYPVAVNVSSNLEIVDEYRATQWQGYINNMSDYDSIEEYMEAQIND